MWDKVADMAKKHWFLIAVVAAALVKQILVIGLPIFAIPSAACDDQLLKNWAFSMASLDWKGDFNAYTFAKEPGFSFFLAVCFRLHLPYIFTVTLGYSVASIVFATSLNKVFSRKLFVFFTYLVILFNPVSFGLYTLQRVYRNGFAMVLTLLVFGGLIHMYCAALYAYRLCGDVGDSFSKEQEFKEYSRFFQCRISISGSLFIFPGNKVL